MKSLRRSASLGLCLLLVLGSSLPAADESSKWDQQIDRAEREILDGKHRAARKRMISTAEEMVDEFGPGKGGEILLGLLALHRALAEAGLGNEEAARWYLHVALAFNPLLVDYGLDRFGAPGRFLLANAPEDPDRSDAEEEEDAGDGAEAPQMIMPGVTPPKSKKRPKPRFPSGARYFRITGALVVQVMISEEGRPTEPKVLVPLPAATLTWAALEALRRWRFEPARVDGEPVAVYYNLTVNYKLRQ